MRPLARPVALCLALLIAIPAGLARAQDRPTLAVPPIAGVGTERARAALAAALKQTGKVSVVETAAVDAYLRDRQAPAAAPKRETPALAALKDGIAAYKNLRIDAAMELLRKAKIGFRKDLGADGAFEGLRAAQFYLAMGHLAKKERGRAKEELVAALVLDPERRTRKLSPKIYSRELRDLFEEARRDVERRGHGDLAVDSASPGETVFVDGKSYGPTPARIASLPEGEHFVRVEAEGKEAYFAPHTVTPGENRVSVELSNSVRVDAERTFGTVSASSDIEPRRAAFLDEMGIALGADVFVLIAAEQGAVRAQLYDQRSQEVSPVERETTPEKLAAKLTTHLDASGYVTSRAPQIAPAPAAAKPLPETLTPPAEGTLSGQTREKPPAPEGLRKSDVWWKNRWVWLGAGLLVAGGVAGALVATGVLETPAETSTLTVRVPGR